jgi:hypothetical protein
MDESFLVTWRIFYKISCALNLQKRCQKYSCIYPLTPMREKQFEPI